MCVSEYHEADSFCWFFKTYWASSWSNVLFLYPRLSALFVYKHTLAAKSISGSSLAGIKHLLASTTRKSADIPIVNLSSSIAVTDGRTKRLFQRQLQKTVKATPIAQKEGICIIDSARMQWRDQLTTCFVLFRLVYHAEAEHLVHMSSRLWNVALQSIKCRSNKMNSSNC